MSVGARGATGVGVGASGATGGGHALRLDRVVVTSGTEAPHLADWIARGH